jgi:4-aminobutyrate aminotransferase/(S)-3-amino-2-methylpropionate transaminase
VSFDHAYHGRTNLTMALTAKSMPYKHGFGPFAPEIYRAPLSYPFRDSEFGKEMATDGELAAKRAISVMDKQVGADNLAAVIIEPIQGEGGFIVPADGFLRRVADFCRDRGILLVADEVQTGIARTGAWFASEHEGIVPDLITIAKGLAGGLPLAAVTGRAEIMDAVHPGGIGGTYSGNPAACAAALGVFDEIENGQLISRAQTIGEILVRELRDIAAGTDVIGEIRGRGAMIAVELVVPGTRTPNRDALAAVTRHCYNNGVLTLTAGTLGNVLRFLPPLSISDELLVEALGVVRDGFASL